MTDFSHHGSRAPARRGMLARFCAATAIGLVCAALAACSGEQFQKGYILPQGALE